jgi:hypothetical protein
MKSRIDKMWNDFYEWPERWKGFSEDVPLGRANEGLRGNLQKAVQIFVEGDHPWHS